MIIVGLYANAALLVAVAFALLGRGSIPSILPAAYGQNQLPIGGGAGMFIVPAQFSPNTYGCYLMDIDAQTLCAYQFFPPEKELRLVAARNFRYDRQLGHFNTSSPTPEEARQLAQEQSQSNRVQDQPAAHAPVEAPKSE